MAILSDAVLDRLSSSFQPESDSDSVNHIIDPKGFLSDLSSRSSVALMKDFVECSDDEPPGYLMSPSTSSFKKQKIASDKRERRTNATTRDLSASTPRCAKSRQVQPKHLGHDKYASKPV